ncbi:MAG: aminotransferase class V-fold PLP-dependent enzyme [Saprospiraceae bacterium]|nr:aminotransferase class V-fold PLP-dependent enzyme [Saprospiraceae bacterium]
MDIKQLRAETPGCLHKIHLNNAGAALMPLPVLAAIQAHLELEATVGGYEAHKQKSAEIQGTYTALARYLNCTPEEVALTSSATDAYARALSSIPFEPGDMILTTESDYASNQIAFLSLKKRFGVRIERFANGPGGQIEVGAFNLAIAALKPRLVAVTHVPTNSGLVQPIAEVGQECRKQDVLFLVDACQSAGQLPLDVQAIGCDFLTATFRKFLRGPRGMGFMYVSNRVLEKGLEPLFIDMRGADWIGEERYLSNPTARRFEDWEFPYALVLGAKAATEYMLEIGPEKIAARNRELCGYLREKLSRIPGLVLLDQGQELCSIVTVFHHHHTPEALQQYLFLQNINTSVSGLTAALIDFEKKGVPGALRLSPHYYNTMEELDATIHTLAIVKG